MRHKRLTRLALALGLCLLPGIGLLVVRLLGGIDAQTLGHTLTGLPVALAGGLLAGAAAEVLLHRSTATLRTLLGMALTAGIGVLTIGYLYLFHIRGPMSSIGALPRAVEQLTLFVAFLLAQGAGMLGASVAARG